MVDIPVASGKRLVTLSNQGRESSERTNELSADEAALYDRQIRLWGLESQKRLRQADVFIYGLSALGSEVVKNIVLAGINSLTICDPEVVTEGDRSGQFMISHDSVGKNRARESLQYIQDLNPMVKSTISDVNISNISKPDFLRKFDIVCVTNISIDDMLSINDICHKEKIKFLAGDVFGRYGYVFIDFCLHEFSEDVKKVNKTEVEVDELGDGPSTSKKAKLDSHASKPPKASSPSMSSSATTMTKKHLDFPCLRDVMALDLKKWVSARKKLPVACLVTAILFEYVRQYKQKPALAATHDLKHALLEIKRIVLEQLELPNDRVPDSFVENCLGEWNPSAAIVGGVYAQEIIKAASNKDQPFNNFFFFDADSGSGDVVTVKPNGF